jgi:ubiquinone/menaquinone biosynthesis C-methylase UbiE
MGFYTEHIYPQLVRLLGDPEPIRAVRRRLVPLAEGSVLEIGVGSGANFVHYDATKVNKLYALEPNLGMIRLAKRELPKTKLDVEFLDLPGERVPLADAAVDTVVSTFTFCTIPGVAEAIRGLRRVLKPGGRLIFFEHGLSPDASVRRRQRWTEPITYRVFAGCHLTRDIPALIKEGGFQIEQMEQAYLARFPKALTYCFWGTAIPRASATARDNAL